MLIDNRGQVSVEIVLLVGLSLIIVLALSSHLGEDVEINKVMAAAKTGSIDASNDLAYNGTGNVIRFKNMTFNNGTINMTVYSKKALNSTSIAYMGNKILNNIAQALNTNITNGTVRGRYIYRINIRNVT